MQHRMLFFSACVLAAVAGACDEQPERAVIPSDAYAQEAVAVDGGKLGDPIAPACRGFSFENIFYSPGGDALPNKCHPFHATLNNPYAVRCVDAWPWYKTPYRGDEYCILPPPPDKGLQVGFHPQQDDYWAQISKQDLSGYQNPAAAWVLKPGGEETKTYRGPAGNPEAHKYYRIYYRMRTGSHHNIITLHSNTQAAGWLSGSGAALDPTSGSLIGGLGGQERPDDNTPVTLARPPEDEGMYTNFPANPSVYYETHFFNTGREPALKEGWVNIWWEEEGTRLTSWFAGLDIMQAIGLNIPPNTVRDLHYAFSPPGPVRIVRFFGHRHAWTPNFSSWVERKDGTIEMIYQSFDWLDMPTFRYDSLAKNPAPDHVRRIDGATSGILELSQGDKLHFNCHIEYTEERAREEGAPSPRANGNLRFANQALTAEMCIGYGSVVGGSLGRVAVSQTPLPEAAKK